MSRSLVDLPILGDSKPRSKSSRSKNLFLILLFPEILIVGVFGDHMGDSKPRSKSSTSKDLFLIQLFPEFLMVGVFGDHFP